MTPEERAKKLVDEHFPDVQGESLIAAAIREAVAAERERCAKVTEEYTYLDPEWGTEEIQDEHMTEIARRIRNGGGT